MAKESGLGWTAFTVDDSGGSTEAIVNDVLSLDISTPRGVQDVTGIDKSAIERLLLLADLQYTANGNFNDAASPSAHDAFKTVPSTSVARTVTCTISGQTLADELFLTDYQLTRTPTGEFTWTVPMLLADGTAVAWS